MTTKNLNQLKMGLRTYGVKGAVSVKLSGDRAIVNVNGEYFGIWDVVKSTFID